MVYSMTCEYTLIKRILPDDIFLGKISDLNHRDFYILNCNPRWLKDIKFKISFESKNNDELYILTDLTEFNSVNILNVFNYIFYILEKSINIPVIDSKLLSLLEENFSDNICVYYKNENKFEKFIKGSLSENSLSNCILIIHKEKNPFESLMPVIRYDKLL